MRLVIDYCVESHLIGWNAYQTQWWGCGLFQKLSLKWALTPSLTVLTQFRQFFDSFNNFLSDVVVLGTTQYFSFSEKKHGAHLRGSWIKADLLVFPRQPRCGLFTNTSSVDLGDKSIVKSLQNTIRVHFQNSLKTTPSRKAEPLSSVLTKFPSPFITTTFLRHKA